MALYFSPTRSIESPTMLHQMCNMKFNQTSRHYRCAIYLSANQWSIKCNYRITAVSAKKKKRKKKAKNKRSTGKKQNVEQLRPPFVLPLIKSHSRSMVINVNEYLRWSRARVHVRALVESCKQFVMWCLPVRLHRQAPPTVQNTRLASLLCVYQWSGDKYTGSATHTDLPIFPIECCTHVFVGIYLYVCAKRSSTHENPTIRFTDENQTHRYMRPAHDTFTHMQ